MKKILVLLTVFIIGSNVIYAQNFRKHEMNLGIGIFTSNDIIDGLASMIVNGLALGTVSQNEQSYGTIHLGYKYHINSRFNVGGVFLYEYSTADAYNQNVRIGDFYKNFFTLAAEGGVNYIKSSYFSFYGLLGAGASIYNQKYKEDITNRKESQSIVHFNFQITPIGLKFGNNYGGYLELGFGYRGIISLGAFAKF